MWAPALLDNTSSTPSLVLAMTPPSHTFISQSWCIPGLCNGQEWRTMGCVGPRSGHVWDCQRFSCRRTLRDCLRIPSQRPFQALRTRALHPHPYLILLLSPVDENISATWVLHASSLPSNDSFPANAAENPVFSTLCNVARSRYMCWKFFFS